MRYGKLHQEFLVSPNGCSLEPSSQQGGRWAEPNVTSARHAMRGAFSHPDLVKKKGEQARRDVEVFDKNRNANSMMHNFMVRPMTFLDRYLWRC